MNGSDAAKKNPKILFILSLLSNCTFHMLRPPGTATTSNAWPSPVMRDAAESPDAGAPEAILTGTH